VPVARAKLVNLHQIRIDQCSPCFGLPSSTPQTG